MQAGDLTGEGSARRADSLVSGVSARRVFSWCMRLVWAGNGCGGSHQSRHSRPAFCRAVVCALESDVPLRCLGFRKCGKPLPLCRMPAREPATTMPRSCVEWWEASNVVGICVRGVDSAVCNELSAFVGYIVAAMKLLPESDVLQLCGCVGVCARGSMPERAHRSPTNADSCLQSPESTPRMQKAGTTMSVGKIRVHVPEPCRCRCLDCMLEPLRRCFAGRSRKDPQ